MKATFLMIFLVLMVSYAKADMAHDYARAAQAQASLNVRKQEKSCDGVDRTSPDGFGDRLSATYLRAKNVAYAEAERRIVSELLELGIQGKLESTQRLEGDDYLFTTADGTRLSIEKISFQIDTKVGKYNRDGSISSCIASVSDIFIAPVVNRGTTRQVLPEQKIHGHVLFRY